MEILLTAAQLDLTIHRLAHQVTENHADLEGVVFIGIQPRGVKFSEQLITAVMRIRESDVINSGYLDITFYRDDVRDELRLANNTEINCRTEGKHVILIDDVLYTGRTIRAALDALQDFGRPRKVELCVLVDRRFNRELPIQPDYCGKKIDSIFSQKVKVEWERHEVLLY